jgi:hypothetical protein
MIGVLAASGELAVVREFFELFKTPWEFFRADHAYDVLLSSGDCECPREGAKLILIYTGRASWHDAGQQPVVTYQMAAGRVLSYRGTKMPLYGESVAFLATGDLLVDMESGRPAIHSQCSGGATIQRIGYNLFEETRLLLTAGQPSSNAAIPTLDLHIMLLRDLIIAGGISFIEIPPTPFGFEFVACLTHDIDHPSLRLHRLDSTMFGFLYRATVGSLWNVARRRLSVGHLMRNWAAALRLPFVLWGVSRDLWRDYPRYVKIECGAPATFFVIPFRNQAGRRRTGSAPKRRAAAYGVEDVATEMQGLLTAGSEIGVHGIDAWLDPTSAEKELGEVRRVTRTGRIGVRMHWLYFDEESVAALESAGADYDSTIGYNETIGYRAGTTQAYKPLSATRLMELPLHVMDTALFYPSYLDLSAREAAEKIRGILDNVERFGGCVTVNWHDRSIAPERLWGKTYADLVAEMRNRRAWFATAGRAVAWFRKRRSVTFQSIRWESGQLHARIGVNAGDDLPSLRLRVHNGHGCTFDTKVVPSAESSGLEPTRTHVAALTLLGSGR